MADSAASVAAMTAGVRPGRRDIYGAIPNAARNSWAVISFT